MFSFFVAAVVVAFVDAQCPCSTSACSSAVTRANCNCWDALVDCYSSRPYDDECPFPSLSACARMSTSCSRTYSVSFNCNNVPTATPAPTPPTPAPSFSWSTPRGDDEDYTTGEIVTVVVFSVVWFFFIICLIVALKATVQVVRHAEVMIVERWGRYRTTLKPGLHFLVPFVDRPRRVHWRYYETSGSQVVIKTIERDRMDMRETVIDFGRQHVITKDTVSIDIDALVYYQVTDAELAVYKIQNLPDAIELLTQTTLRNIMAQMTLDDTFSSRDLINSQLKEKTQLDAERWGVTITHVEIMNILPPDDIKRVMEEQIREERERRSTVISADGNRESSIVRAQGTRAKTVLDAEATKATQIQAAKGAAEARLLKARAEAGSVTSIADALKQTGARVQAADYLVALRYIEKLKESAQSGETKVTLLPSETYERLGELMKKVE